jgi:hypothetical protein
MPHEFTSWAQHLIDSVRRDAVIIEFSIGAACDNPSARLIIDAPEFIAEIVVWESRIFRMEIIDASSERTLYALSDVIGTDVNFDDACAAILSILQVRDQFSEIDAFGRTLRYVRA